MLASDGPEQRVKELYPTAVSIVARRTLSSCFPLRLFVCEGEACVFWGEEAAHRRVDFSRQAGRPKGLQYATLSHEKTQGLNPTAELLSVSKRADA